MNRLLLLEYDELVVVWDALMRHRLFMDPGDPDFQDCMNVLNRVGELMADSVDKMGNPELK